MAEPLLSVERVSHRFGGLLAVDAATLAAPGGRITGLIGPNGAGKTTLFAIISGFLAPSSGRISYAGEDVTGEPPHRLARRGMARTFQIVQPFAGLSVRHNILVGAHLRHRTRAAALDVADTRRPRGRPRRLARSPRAYAHRRRAQAARTRPRARDRTETPSARRGARRIEPVGNSRHRAGHPRHQRTRRRRRHDRACDAGGDEPVRTHLRAGGGPHHRRRQPRPKSRPIRRWSKPISVTARRRRSEPAMSTEPLLDVQSLHAGYGDGDVLLRRRPESRRGRNRRGARLERRRQIDAQPRDLRRGARALRRRSASPAPRSSAKGRRRSSRAASFTCRRAGAFSRTCRSTKTSTSAATGAPPRGASANRERVFAIFPRLRERRSQRAGTLSGGEQQMLAIGRGLMARAAAPHPRRAFAGLVAAPGRGTVHADRTHPRRRRRGSAGRAERRAKPRHRPPRLHPRRRALRHIGARRRYRAPIRNSNAPIWDCNA